jgi:hypothetical protein
MADAATEFAALAYALREAGERGLKREMDRALNDAAQPVARLIGAEAHLKEYMPDRYAGVLAPDLKVSTRKRSTGENPDVTIIATTRGLGGVKRRRIRRLNQGALEHPLFGDRKRWFRQADGVQAGFFDDPVNRAGPAVREQIVAALERVREKIYAAR